jgi:hypothetical protein
VIEGIAAWSRLAVAAAAVGAAAGVVAHVSGPDALTMPPPAREFTLDTVAAGAVVRFAVDAPDGRVRQVTVTVGDRRAAFVHATDRRRSFRFVAPADGAVQVRVTPEASVAQVRTDRRTREVRLGWTGADPPAVLRAPVVDHATGTVRGAVDETDVYGQRNLGVPVREVPRIRAAALAVVRHGELLTASCWTLGDEVTTGNPDEPTTGDPYVSSVWFRVALPGDGMGYVPDARFLRTGASTARFLPECDD